MFIFCLARIFLDWVFLGFRTHVVETTACTTRCTHTHLSHAHFSVAQFLSVHNRTSSCVSHTRMAQVPEKVHCTCVVSLHLAVSLLMIHLSLLFLHGHFETNPDNDFTDSDIHMILPNFPDLIAQVKHNSALASRSLTTWPAQVQTQVMSPRSSTRSLLWTVTRYSSMIRTTISPISRKPTNENTGQFGVPTVFESSLLHVSHGWCCSSKRKQRKHAIGKPFARQRKRRERRFFVISAAESKSMKNRRNSVRSHSLQTHKEFYSDYRDLRGHLQWRAQQVTFGENSVQRKSHSTEYDMEIQNLGTKKFRIRIIWLTAWAGTSKTTIIGRNSLDRDHGILNTFLQRIEDEEPSSSKMPRKKLPRIWRIEKMLLSRGNTKKTTKIGKIPRSMIRNHEQWVHWRLKIFYDLDSTSSYDIPTFLIMLSLPRVRESRAAKLECRKMHERVWVFLETFLIVHMLNDILMNCTIILGIWRHFGYSENRRNWENCERGTIAITTFTLFFSKSEENTSWRQTSVMSMTNHVLGIWTWHDNSELSPLGDASVIPWPNKISEPDREAPSRSLRKGSW